MISDIKIGSVWANGKKTLYKVWCVTNTSPEDNLSNPMVILQKQDGGYISIPVFKWPISSLKLAPREKFIEFV